MNSLLIIGGSGFLGGNLAHVAASRWDTYCTYFTKKNEGAGLPNLYQLDIKNYNEVKKIFNIIYPKVIIHSAAISSSVSCEENKKEAWDTNVLGTKNVALAAERIKAKLIYISTDLIFEGTRMFYTEKENPNPICYYGKTKYEGEKIVSALCSDFIIARVGLIYGKSLNTSKCSTEKLVQNLRNRNLVPLFFDEYRTPIYINDLCKILLDIAERTDTREIYNICGSERLSRYQFGLKAVDVFNLNKETILKVSSNNQIFNKFIRPKDCSMSNEKVISKLKSNFLSVEEGLKDMMSKY